MTDFGKVIKGPVVTEKSASISGDGTKLVLKVAKYTNKIEIRQAVESAFNVKVKSINTITVRPKKKRVGRYTGKTSQYKKAIITLQEGSKLDLS